MSGRDENYATLIINKGIREEAARHQAEIYKKLVTEDKCEFYAHKYAASIINGKDEKKQIMRQLNTKR